MLRTPEEQFEELPGYDFAPHYADVGGLRMHYVMEGNNAEEVVLMLHGEPSWSYLYRKMIKKVAAAGYTVVAPDLIGFGKSDKPTRQDAYTYQTHMDWLGSLTSQLGLENITLVCQDWGGLLGLRMVAGQGARFKRVLAANTMLPTGQKPPNEAFDQWKTFSQTVPELPVGKIIAKGCAQPLGPGVLAAYDAPFPDERYKAGARVFPLLVPTSSDDPAAVANAKAWDALKRWEKPFLTAFSDQDPIMQGLDRVFQKLVPGAQGQPHTTINNAGHFLQEDQGEALAEVAISFIQNN